MTAVQAGNINVKWDPKSLEIRTLAVERLLEPLVTQVTTLVNTNSKGPSGKKTGRSKKAHVLAASVEQATENFLDKGDKIAKENQFLKEELVAAVEDRGNMVRAARALLCAVTQVLILADMAEVYKLLVQLKVVEGAKRQQELKDVGHRDQKAAARGILQKNVPILCTASQACLQHPDVTVYEANRDLIYKQLQQAVTGISNAAQATASDDASRHKRGGGGELAYALNNFEKQIIVLPLSFSEERFRSSLEERLESIISGAALMADSSCTRDDRPE
ncbi:Catenin alpha-1 [Saguinus oedipus]|uniref:Catenin alpha-1 n=1 Tax=Saguinus oedipus TaxID=9490 RepID=A0ABQ9UMW5_SAGOE|nr:Catenin alpha-1 [Saguinus oedipus]